jgi:mono/diheme cytochrome c family protein
MPSFAWQLSDADVAAVVTYIRNAWGNAAPAISVSAVFNIRQTLHRQAQAREPLTECNARSKPSLLRQ